MAAGNTEFNLQDQSVMSNKGHKTMDDAKLICSSCRTWMGFPLYRVRTRTQLATSMAHRKNTTIIIAEATLFISGESCGSSSTSRRTAMGRARRQEQDVSELRILVQALIAREPLRL